MVRPQEFVTADVLHKALALFWTKGYEATSMADLLAATGLSKSSLYATFGGKRDLFLAAYEAYRRERSEQAQAILDSGPARQALEAFFRMIVSHAGNAECMQGCMIVNQAVELAPQDPEIRDRVAADLRLIEDAFARTIARGQADGSIASKQDARKLARLLFVAFAGFQVMVRGGGSDDPARLDDALTMLLAVLD